MRIKVLFCLEHLATSKEHEDFAEEAVSNNYHINNDIVVSCQLITFNSCKTTKRKPVECVVKVNKRYHHSAHAYVFN